MNIENDSNQNILLPTISEDDPDYLQLIIYFFGTPDSITIFVSKQHLVGQLIGHLLALAEREDEIRKLFIRDIPPSLHDNYKNNNFYELRLVDDDNDFGKNYLPLDDMGAIDNDNPIGTFPISEFVICRASNYDMIIQQIEKGNFSFILANKMGCEGITKIEDVKNLLIIGCSFTYTL